MVTFTKLRSQKGWRTLIAGSLKVVLSLFLLSFFTLNSRAQTVDFHQARNHFQNNYAIDWVSGILNATHTEYFEGIGIAQRVVFTDLTPGSHTATFKVLAAKGGIHAYDYLMSWEQAWKTAQNIGNGATNELLSLAAESGGVITVNEATAFKDALTETAKDNITNNATNPTPSQIAGYFTQHARGMFVGTPGNLLGDNISNSISCFEGIYGTRDFEIRGDAAFSGTPTITFNNYDNDALTGDTYAFYTIAWNSASSIVAIRFAGHPAIGVGQLGLSNCNMGYGLGKGAGSISGGPYHFKLLTIDGTQLGNQDNQLQSGAIKIPPTCGLTGPGDICPNTGYAEFTYQGTNAANAALVFTFLTNTANATFASDGSTLNTLNATANSSGAYTLRVYPKTGGFTVGGDFQVNVSAATNDGSCTQAAGVTHITDVKVAATATPTSISIISAAHNSVLNAYATIDDGTPTSVNNTNSDFGFAWTVLAPYTLDGSTVKLAISPFTVVGTLANANTAEATFTAAAAAAGQSIGFRVTATESATPGCSNYADVSVPVNAGPGCPDVPTSPVCSGTTNTYTADRAPATDETWLWSADNGATVNSVPANGGQSVSVTAGTSDFVLTLTISYSNRSLPSRSCTYNVTVKPRPTGSADGQSICSGDQTNVTLNSNITGTTFAWTAALQSGTATGFSNCSASCGTAIQQTLTNSGTTNAVVRYTVTPTADGCPGTPFNVDVTVKPRPTGSADNASICSGDQTNVALNSTISSTTFTWTAAIQTAPTGGSITGFSSCSSACGSAIQQTLTNSGTTNGVVRYVVTPTYNGCTGAPFNVDVTVKPVPSCTITGDAVACLGATKTYSSSVLPAGGTVVHTWSIIGDASFAAGADIHAASISVVANSSGASFTLRDDITRDGCPSYCTKTVNLVDCAGNCSYTQGYYGGKGKSCDGGVTYPSPTSMIQHLLDIGGPITAGLAGSGHRSVVVGTGDAAILASVMPGGSTPRQLDYDGQCNLTTSGAISSCIGLANGKLNNVLLSQTIALTLNMRLKGGSLVGFTVPTGTFTTYALTDCSSTATVVPGTEQSFTIPDVVNTYLGAGATVQDLLNLANATLSDGPQTRNSVTPSASAVNQAVDAINRGFDKCRTTAAPMVTRVSGGVTTEMVQVTDKISVQAYPNPFNDIVKFTIESNVSGQAQLDVFNMLGQRVTSVYNGFIQAGKTQVVVLKAGKEAQQNLLYVLRIGNEKVTGKLLNAK